MSVSERYICDICGQDRAKDANHWWVMRSGIGHLLVAPLDKVAKPSDPCCKHLCGRACVLAMTERFMATGALDAPDWQEGK
jgi:hypothetical protein